MLNNAKKRKHKYPVTITVPELFEQLKVQDYKDYYTGCELSLDYVNEPLVTPTMDRLDNTKGYEKGNVVITIWAANTAKSALSYDEFIKLCQKIVEHHNTKELEKSQNAWAAALR